VLPETTRSYGSSASFNAVTTFESTVPRAIAPIAAMTRNLLLAQSNPPNSSFTHSMIICLSSSLDASANSRSVLTAAATLSAGKWDCRSYWHDSPGSANEISQGAGAFVRTWPLPFLLVAIANDLPSRATAAFSKPHHILVTTVELESIRSTAPPFAAVKAL